MCNTVTTKAYNMIHKVYQPVVRCRFSFISKLRLPLLPVVVSTVPAVCKVGTSSVWFHVSQSVPGAVHISWLKPHHSALPIVSIVGESAVCILQRQYQIQLTNYHVNVFISIMGVDHGGLGGQVPQNLE